ncbi:hypothetical protein [Kineococcus sp. SYSU DK003]|uniref:hypothetical protein n=1 Tax=Kineococcus sp. SYSU DK003 TaxID=3383124 RepID=UPI003D7ED833
MSVPPGLPVPVDWAPSPQEVEPECKLAAVQAVTAALTVPPDASSSLPRPLAPLARLLPAAGPTAVQVLYPQYGGLSRDRRRACVVLTVDLWSSTPTALRREGSTLDVRLQRDGRWRDGRWRVVEVLVPDAVRSVQPVPAPAAAVLQNPRIAMPALARLDVAGGLVDDRVLTLLTALSARWELSVQVFAAGHPWDVFETGRPSNHTLGRAVDLHALDGVPVVDQDVAGPAPWRELALAAEELGSDEIGGPDRARRRRPFFTDDVHRDHVHLGFEFPAHPGL